MELTEEMLRCAHVAYTRELNEAVESERYEAAAAFRDVIKILSDAILGYRDADKEVMDILFYCCMMYGNLVDINEEDESETYELEGCFFQFANPSK